MTINKLTKTQVGSRIPNSSANSVLFIDSNLKLAEDSNITWDTSVLTLGGTIAMGTNQITGVGDPTLDQDAATKAYVDNSVSFDFQLFTNDTASDIGGIYYAMTDSQLGGGESTLTTAGLSAATNDQATVNWASPSGGLGILEITGGIYTLHIHAEKTAGTSDLQIYGEIYKRASGGAETLISTTEISSIITSKTQTILHTGDVVDQTILATDRIVVKILANCGGGSGATLVLYQEGSTSSHLAFPATSNILNQIFVRQDGTKPLTANWDVGAFTITGTQFISDIAIGTAPFVVTSTTVVANLQAATVATITGLAPDTATTQATQAAITTCANLTTVGALDSGSITSNFGAIDNGASNITTTGTITGTTLNGTSALQLNGTDINTGATLSNVAYLDQTNTFTNGILALGVEDTTQGALTLHGTATGEGGQINIKLPGDADGTFENWTIDVGAGDYMRIFASDASVLHYFSPTVTIFNETGQDVDFRVEASGAVNALFVQGSDGNVGIGTAVPASSFHVVTNDAAGLITLQNINTGDNTPKRFLIQGIHYDIDEEKNLAMWQESAAATTKIRIGGGQNSHNAATEIGFYTAADNTTVTGTSRMTISSAGLVNVVGEITAGTKTFKIDHPVDPDNKILYHMAIEGPRVDLIYRGTTTLVKGKATIDLNKDSSVVGMIDGTFEALTQNSKVTSLHAQESFDRVKSGVITGATFEITSENTESTDEVAWVVMAERADQFIKSIDKTDAEGHLIPEQDKEDSDLSLLEDEIVTTDKIEEDKEETIETVEMKGKGYKIHYQAYGEELPTRKVIKQYVEPVVVEEPEIIEEEPVVEEEPVIVEEPVL